MITIPMEGAIIPHRYPFWIKIFAGAIVIATLYSLFILPEYIVAAKKMRSAEDSYNLGNYTDSIDGYRYVLETVPTSKKARIGAAEAIFADGDKSNDEVGLGLLQGITLDQSNWSRIITVMPVEYQKYFGDIKQ